MANPIDAISALVGAAQGGDVSGAAQDLVASAIQGVTIESQVLPTLTFNPSVATAGAAPATTSSGFDLLSWIRPKFSVQLAGGGTFDYAPAGDPVDDYTPHFFGGLLLALAGVAFLGHRYPDAIKATALAGGGLVLAGIARNRLVAS